MLASCEGSPHPQVANLSAVMLLLEPHAGKRREMAAHFSPPDPLECVRGIHDTGWSNAGPASTPVAVWLQWRRAANACGIARGGAPRVAMVLPR